MPQTILAFDFGLRRIGIAVGQDVTGSASPVTVIANTDKGIDRAEIATIIAEWQPSRLIVGMPMQADGSAGAIGDAVKAFIDELRQFDLPIETVDERYTSVEAERTLKQARSAGIRGRISKEHIDAAAAVIIAERYLATQQ